MYYLRWVGSDPTINQTNTAPRDHLVHWCGVGSVSSGLLHTGQPVQWRRQLITSSIQYYDNYYCNKIFLNFNHQYSSFWDHRVSVLLCTPPPSQCGIVVPSDFKIIFPYKCIDIASSNLLVIQNVYSSDGRPIYLPNLPLRHNVDMINVSVFCERCANAS